MERLFVYGTLAPGRPNHDVLSDIQGTWQQAILKGTLVEAGWGAEFGCPGIVPCIDGEEVAGFVLTSSHLASHWARLDAFEGDGYERMLVTVNTGGEDLEAYVYALSDR